MTSEVIDSAQCRRLSWCSLREEHVMTSLTVPTTGTAEQLRRVLRLDGVVTAGVGLVGLLGPAWYGGPAWVARVVGAAFVLIGVEVALLARASRIRLVGTVVAELAFAWVVTAVALAELVDMEPAGQEVLLATAVITLGFGIAETRLAKALPR
jgi:hypothetical protein